MKIAVLTYNFNNNYGGMLQAYAMMNTLKKLNHDPELLLVKTISMSRKDRLKYRLKKYFFCYFSEKWGEIKYKDEIEQNTNYFIKKYITPTTSPIYKESHFKQATKNNYDAYLVGSDQIWRAKVYRYIDYAFFGFVEDKSPIFLSYAASFGVDTWDYTEEQTAKFSQQLEKFNGISVREDSGVQLCQKHFNKEAVHVLDPTLLLDADDYKRLAEQENEPDHNGDLLTYILDANVDKKAIIDSVSDECGLKPFQVNKKPIEDITKENLHEAIYPTVTSWLKGFDCAKYVITDSFHGCVFAILFNIPFIAVGNKARGMARFNSLLNMFDLGDRLVLESKEVTSDMIKQVIDWQNVNKKLDDLRTYSLDYLISTLNEK